ncbi:glycine cleavage system aminomethyltransferase GcvT [Chloroflexi bacterium TSY]|nr:glycine cleavage system aminomethyltransferase GcvT [Chloroflexi bacterium TSY]
MSNSLKRTILFQWHVDHGARMVPFAGWEMPVQYQTGPIAEHHITRRSAGLFDIDHMGQIIVEGKDAESYLNQLVSWDLRLMQEGEAHYALMCYEHGGIVDDLFIYKLPDRWFVVVNAANREQDFVWMQNHVAEFDVTLTDISDETYMMALQGPNALNLIERLMHLDFSDVPRFTVVETTFNDTTILIGRTGYTGEDGVELFLSVDSAATLWKSILQMGHDHQIEVNPIGLAARDSLRFEPGFALYGHEINADITPLEARLSWACRFDHEFIGRDALLAQKEAGLTKKLISFELTERGVPRENYIVTNEQGIEIGQVVTGLYAPTVDKYCGNAFVAPEYAKVGTLIQVMIRNKPKAGVVVKRPLYKPSYR